ncbi:GNAT family N-acetyltransferase [Enorma massiliensis]|uniref:GNAT family N-acetyltransferase n=1 Tax=Enorma massiliensis TaxID=1472761 RepID=UPI0002DA301E|nr:GNAT family N-acetyltransferase [Enorma massiliensis]CDD40344.1 putative acetyltransferase [Collinsella sp. CAG:398]
MPYATHENDVQYLADDGTVLGEVTFPSCGDGIVDINHTFVDGSLRGQGIAGELLSRAAAELEKSGRRAHPSCSYAVRWFEKHAEYAHLLAE